MVIKKHFGSESRDVLIMCLRNGGPVKRWARWQMEKRTADRRREEKGSILTVAAKTRTRRPTMKKKKKKSAMGSLWKICTRACWTLNARPPSLGAGRRGLRRCTRCRTYWLAFIRFFTSDARWSSDMGHRRATRALSLLPTHLSLSLCVQMSQTRHRAMTAPEIALAPGNVQELSRILQGRKRDTSYIAFWSFVFFFIQHLATFIITSKKNTHHHNYRKTTKKKRTPLLPPQELCEKTTLEPCPQRQSTRMEEVHIVRKDLVHLRNYALKVVRSFFFFWC